jgi:hypothetical protein
MTRQPIKKMTGLARMEVSMPRPKTRVLWRLERMIQATRPGIHRIAPAMSRSVNIADVALEA